MAWPKHSTMAAYCSIAQHIAAQSRVAHCSLDYLVQDERVCRDEERAECPPAYRSFLKAAAKTHPVVAILDPACAMTTFPALLQPGHIIECAAARNMHLECSMNSLELHGVKVAWHSCKLDPVLEAVGRLRCTYPVGTRGASSCLTVAAELCCSL